MFFAAENNVEQAERDAAGIADGHFESLAATFY
jgi:hypothetical protein